MTDTTWAAKVLGDVPVAYFNTRQADTPSGNLLPEQWMPAADVIAAIEALEAEVARLRDELSLIAVMGYGANAAEHEAIARLAVQRARAALTIVDK